MPDIYTDHHPPTEQPTVTHAHPHQHAIQSVQRLMHEKEHQVNFFTAYRVRPRGMHFANQEPDEVILVFLRHHFITNIPWMLNTIFFALIPPLLFGISLALPTPLFTLPGGLAFVLVAFYYLLLSSYAFGKFISWFYNIGIVTQKRMIDLDTSNILAHNTATANFSELVEVKFTQRGFFQSYFDYGDIHIQTEAVRANFEFLAAPKPSYVTDIISDLRVAQEGGKHANS